jgi:hypothetical protein
MTVEGPRKRKTLDENYVVRSSDPTRAFSPSQLPTDHFNAVRSANISVINRRASSEAVIGPAVQNPCSKLHRRDRVPPTPPVETFLCARTVLAFNGSLRRAKLRRTLDRCAPFRPTGNRDGRLRREHDAIPWNQKPKPRPLKRLDRSFHISFRPVRAVALGCWSWSPPHAPNTGGQKRLQWSSTTNNETGSAGLQHHARRSS